MPASELFAVLGLDQESNIQQQRDQSGETSLSGDSMSIDSKSCAGPMIKSKVINSGGTVIVLTESDQQQRSVVGHSVPSMAQIEPSGSFVNEAASYGAETVRSPQSKIGPEHHDFNVERRSDDDDNVDEDDRLMDHPDYQVQTTGPSLLSNPKPSGDFGPVNSHTPTSPYSAYKVTKSPPGSVQNFKPSESAIKGKVSMQISLKTERNNNSLGSRQVGNNVNSNDNDSEQIEAVVLDAKNNLSARYDNILFQKSQDYGRLPNDEDCYMIHNRVKGKVH